jgi:hypothetical protein
MLAGRETLEAVLNALPRPHDTKFGKLAAPCAPRWRAERHPSVFDMMLVWAGTKPSPG